MDITAIKDIVLIGAALGGAAIALKGLYIWKEQLTFRVDYDLARRLLISILKYRDEVDRVRDSLMWTTDRPIPTQEEAVNMTPEQIEYYGLAGAYQTRWSRLQTIRLGMYADLLESEAIWGRGFKDSLLPVLDLERELHTNIRRFLEVNNPRVNSASKEVLSRRLREDREVMYSDPGEEPDSLFQYEMSLKF